MCVSGTFIMQALSSCNSEASSSCLVQHMGRLCTRPADYIIEASIPLILLLHLQPPCASACFVPLCAPDMALKLLGSSSSSSIQSRATPGQEPSRMPTASAAAAGSHAAASSNKPAAAGGPGLRSGGSFSDLRLLVSSMRQGASPARPGVAASAAHAQVAGSLSPAAGRADADSADSASVAGSSGPWWLQPRSQVLAVVLVLLSVAHLAVSRGAAFYLCPVLSTSPCVLWLKGTKCNGICIFLWWWCKQCLICISQS